MSSRAITIRSWNEFITFHAPSREVPPEAELDATDAAAAAPATAAVYAAAAAPAACCATISAASASAASCDSSKHASLSSCNRNPSGHEEQVVSVSQMLQFPTHCCVRRVNVVEAVRVPSLAVTKILKVPSSSAVPEKVSVLLSKTTPAGRVA